MIPLRNILVTLECFVKKNGKYLMLHRNPDKRLMPGVWMAPGGKREFNEGLFEAARREVLEETGLKIKNIRIRAAGNAYLKDLDQEIYFHLVFADWESGKLTHNYQDGTFVWLTPSEILKLDNLLTEIKKVGRYLFDEKIPPISYKAVYDKGNNMTDFEMEKGKEELIWKPSAKPEA